ncbi:MAG TPA: 2Fe-2S iron-sulfur cluster-binding protein [Steroidobacteraceae bacterium]|nr:2Fe-2S iron-sulfur cluster-binding protein [Steroidobacteraceae bacterium]
MELRASVSPRLLLSDFLREQARVGGVHVACGQGVCGACTVVVDGVPVRACLMLAIQADGTLVQTIASLPQLEGNEPQEGLTRLQRAFRHHHALQCGYCTPGLLVATAKFLATTPAPDRAQILEHLNGHLCRCSGYANIVAAIESVRA